MPSSNGREVVIVEAARTPIGRGHPEHGYYRGVHAQELLARVLSEVVDRAGIPADAVENVVVGCVNQYGEQSLNVGRRAWLAAGLPIETPATTVDTQCGSAQQAVNLGAALIASGTLAVVIGGGVEHMGHVPIDAGAAFVDQVGSPRSPALMEHHSLVSQGIAAEMIADQWEISRHELDELALRSHRLAQRATDEGRFTNEIAPMTIEGETIVVDQGIRPDTSLERLAALRPAFKADGKITAGNSSQISDGAAAVLLMSAERAQELGLAARARVLDHITVGVDPVTMLTGPIPATRQMLDRNGLAAGDVDLYEVNEAFAPVVAAWQREIGADMDRVNVNGGAMALGHPLGSSGARLLTTVLHELERRDAELGLVTMCCAGGLGTGTLVQRV
jgi:acetyl-CoA acetyltransferase family protein